MKRLIHGELEKERNRDDVVEPRTAKSKRRRNTLLAAAATGGVLSLGGCDYTYNYPAYPSTDGGCNCSDNECQDTDTSTEPDTDSDTGTETDTGDAGVEELCPDGVQLDCEDNVEFEQYVEKGEVMHLELMEGASVHIRVDDIYEESSETFVTLSIAFDENCENWEPISTPVPAYSTLQLNSIVGNIELYVSGAFIPDAGQPGTVLKATKVCEEAPEECTVDVEPEITCGSSVSGTISQNNSIPVGEFALQLMDVEGSSAILSLVEADCSPLLMDMVDEGETHEMTVGEITIRVTVEDTGIMETDEGPVKWADLTVERICIVECEGESYIFPAILNQNEILSLLGAAPYKIRNDDISIYPLDEPPEALISILDSDDALITPASIPEEDTEQYVLGPHTLTITIDEVAPGYTFGAKWIDITVEVCDNS